MKIGFVPLCCVGQQRELGYAENVPINVFDAGFPHLLGIGGTRKDSKIYNLVSQRRDIGHSIV